MQAQRNAGFPVVDPAGVAKRHLRHIRFWYHGEWYCRATWGRWSRARVPVGSGRTQGEALAALAARILAYEAEEREGVLEGDPASPVSTEGEGARAT